MTETDPSRARDEIIRDLGVPADFDVDAEIERLRPLIELGGYIPCPDHRIAPDAKFENVQYYCEKMHNLKI